MSSNNIVKHTLNPLSRTRLFQTYLGRLIEVSGLFNLAKTIRGFKMLGGWPTLEK